MMFEIQMMWAYVQGFAREQSTRARSEAGASAVEWALIVAGGAAIALAVVAIIRRLATGTANNVPTG